MNESSPQAAGAGAKGRLLIPTLLTMIAFAAAFSFTYVSLSAGTGALILFGAVQATMILHGLRRGQRFAPLQTVGNFLRTAVYGTALAACDPCGDGTAERPGHCCHRRCAAARRAPVAAARAESSEGGPTAGVVST